MLKLLPPLIVVPINCIHCPSALYPIHSIPSCNGMYLEAQRSSNKPRDITHDLHAYFRINHRPNHNQRLIKWRHNNNNKTYQFQCKQSFSDRAKYPSISIYIYITKHFVFLGVRFRSCSDARWVGLAAARKYRFRDDKHDLLNHINGNVTNRQLSNWQILFSEIL